RFAVCVDTAHAFAAGYDLRSAEGWETTWAELDREVGLERLAAIHVNDSAVPFDSRKDRHANLGHGEMGTEPFRRLVTDRRTSRVPLFLETPGGTPAWEEETAWLRVEAADPQGTGPHSNLRDRGGVPGR
ncbi:MAG: TIM barrel protein, partial [Thiohalorhabdus sp.]|uniref:TIM barrel protein n=1 Tax=Thiohalorhabdus sp. TaxID=3094134 RepID=UPI00398134C1